MRTTIFIGIFLMAGILFAQQENVPENAKQDFQSNYPNVTNVEWKQNDNGYEATFEENGRKTSVMYDNNGTLQETKKEIDQTELPQAVTDAVASQYAQAEISEVWQVEKDGQNSYKVAVSVDGEEKYAVFSEDGQLLKEKEGHRKEHKMKMD